MLGFLFFAIALSSANATLSPPTGAGQTIFDRFGLPFSPVATDKEAQSYVTFRAQAQPGGELSLATENRIHIVSSEDRPNGIPVDNIPFEQLLYERLAQPAPLAENRTLYLTVAKRYWLDAGTSSLWIELNPDVHFWDGSKLTAQDVKASIDISMDKNSYAKKLLKDIYGDLKIEAVNDQTVHLTFAGVPPDRIRDAVYYALVSFPIVKKLQEKAPAIEVPMEYQGTGPYQVESVKTNQAEIVRDPNYWGNRHPFFKNLYNVARVKFIVLPDAFTQRLAFGRGDISFLQNVNPAAIESVKKSVNKMLTMRAKDTQILHKVIYLNTERPFISDVNFRRALNQVLDFEFYNRMMYSNQFSLLRAPLDRASFAPRGPLSTEARALLAKYSGSVPDGIKNDYEKIGYYERNPRLSERDRLHKAYEILHAAGYRYNSDRKLTLNGEVVHLTMLSSQLSGYEHALLLFQKDLRSLGIDVLYRALPDWASMVAAEKARDYDLFVGGFNLERGAESLNVNFLNQYFLSAYADNHVQYSNPANLRSPLMDWTLAQLTQTLPSNPEFRPLAEIFLRVLSAEMPMLMLGEQANSIAFAAQNLCVFPVTANPIVTMYFSDHCPTSL